jgi:hypothetical protein
MKIEKRHLVTGALLAFVAVTGVTLAVKETRHARAVALAEAARPSPPPVAPTPAEAGPASPATAPAVAIEPPAELPANGPGAPKSASKATAPASPAPRPDPAPAAVPPPAPAPPTVLVTYFHTTARCTSCLKIEDLTNATMTTRLSGPVAEKRVVFRSVNVDDPENAHFVKDYGLYTKSVVVSEVRDGREVRWKNLDQVWHLLGNPESFQSYVEREVRAYLEKA